MDADCSAGRETIGDRLLGGNDLDSAGDRMGTGTYWGDGFYGVCGKQSSRKIKRRNHYVRGETCQISIHGDAFGQVR